MVRVVISEKEFEEILPKICNLETSLDQKNWTKDNPLQGHCAVVSLLAQKLFGGELLRASLENTVYSESRSHYKNKLPNGERDFTIDQFKKGTPENLEFKIRDRIGDSGVLSIKYPDTMRRYAILNLRLVESLEGENPLFKNEFYIKTISQALISPCKKMGFGSILALDGDIVEEAYNDIIPELKYMCEPKCIRENIVSRTESLIGACGHAEEWVMKKARDKRIPLKECDLYVAGIKPDGITPWIKEEAIHTCLRCSIQMYYAELKSINVPVVNKWESMTPQEALRTSSEYALKIGKKSSK